MNGLGLNKVNNFVVGKVKNKLGSNLFAVISTGSVASKNYKKSWSDIDILIVVMEIDLKTKRIIAETISTLSKKLKQRLGVNVISKEEAENPELSGQSLEGKTLQTLLDLRKAPERIIFCKTEKAKFYCPNKEEIKKYSLSNIAMLLLSNRRNLTTQIPRTLKEYKYMTEKTIHLAFIITKLAIQYFNLNNCTTNQDIIDKAEKLFKDFNFSVLKRNLRVIDRWSETNNHLHLERILQLTDNFIEKFSHYVFKKAAG